jgi:hypothetical protein
MQLEAFMGCSAYMGADEYTARKFTFDRAQGMADVHVAEYAQLAAADSAAGTWDRSMAKLVSFARATYNALDERLTSGMTDATTQEVVDILGRWNLVWELTQKNFPNGIPTQYANEVTDYMEDIQNLATRLTNVRKNWYLEAMKEAQVSELVQKQEIPIPTAEEIKAGIASGKYPSYAGTTQKEWLQWALTSGYYPTYASQFSTDAPMPSIVDTGVPGDGAAGEAGQVISDEVVVEKTAMQKYGPVAALVAGGLAAYLALR